MMSGGMGRVERYFKFCVVGGTGMLVDMGVLWLIVSLLGLKQASYDPKRA
jgi:putative flippase GtrA